MRVIFLDIDGVLNNHDFARRTANGGIIGIDPTNVAALNLILAEVPDACIVVSSSWRRRFNTPVKMRERLAQEGVDPARVFDLTPTSGRMLPSTGLILPEVRGREISAWRESYGHDGPYVIIDDDSDARRIADALYGHVARPESKGEGSAPGSWHVHVGANDVWLHPTPDPHEWRLVHRYGFDPSVGPFLAYVLHATVEADR